MSQEEAAEYARAEAQAKLDAMKNLPNFELLQTVQQYIKVIDSGVDPDLSEYENLQKELKSNMNSLTTMIKNVKKGKLDKFPVMVEPPRSTDLLPYE
jgi:hypothetical protein